jgi:hypothetical protein
MILTHKFPKIAGLIIIGLLLAGCSAFQLAPTATPTPAPTSTPVPTVTPTPTPGFPLPEGKIIFEKPGGKKFAGTIHGQGETAIIMANMSSGGEAQWNPFVEAVDQQKFTVVTFNYLQANYVGAAQETNIVLKRLRESGYKRVVCIGASLGVTSCASIAREPEMVGIVLVAGPNNGGSLEATYPKLFIAGGDDRWAVDTQKAYDLADDPKTLVLFPGNGAHGAGLFYSADSDEFLKLLIDFVNSATP